MRPRPGVSAFTSRAVAFGIAVAIAIVVPASARSEHAGVRSLTRGKSGQVQTDVRKCSLKRRHGKRKRVSCRMRISHGHSLDAVSGGLIVGLDAEASGWGGASTAGHLNHIISQTGTKWLRERFLWSTIEPSPGVFSFAYFDHFMLLAAQRGEHIMALLDSAPSWAAPDPSAIPSDPSTYGAYVAAVIRRYGPHGTFWVKHPNLRASAIRTYELWNEPYYNNGNDGNYDPPRYAQLVKAAGIAGHTADPSVTLLLSAEMQSEKVGGQWVWWVDALYRAVPDLNRYFDGVAIHAYGNSNVTQLNPIIPGVPYNNYDNVRRAENIRQLFINHGGGGKPFWITEVGWSTCSDGNIDCVSWAQQAVNLTALFGLLRTSWKSWVQAVLIYRYTDGSNPSAFYDGYGLTTPSGAAKPALAVFRAAALTSSLGP